MTIALKETQVLTPYIIGLDVGWRQTKVAVFDQNRGGKAAKGKLIEFSFPSRLALFAENLTDEQASDDFNQAINGTKFSMYRTMPGGEEALQHYFVGEDAVLGSDNRGTILDESRIGSEDELAFALYAIASTLKPTHKGGLPRIATYVVTGLPVDYYMSHHTVLEHAWLGTHCVELNGKPIVVDICEIKTVLQPHGGMYDLMLDLDARGNLVVADKNRLKRPHAVIDIGFNTTDITTMLPDPRRGDGIYLSRDKSIGFTFGVADFHRRLKRFVRQDHGIRLDETSIEAIIQQKFVGYRDVKVDIGPQITRAQAETAAELTARITELWRNREFAFSLSNILLIGGGAVALRAAIESSWPYTYEERGKTKIHAEIPADPSGAIARGYCKRALLPSVFGHQLA